MKKSPKPEASTLRQKAEELLDINLRNSDLHLSPAEAQKLIHELEVHQIELNLQNEELLLAIEQSEIISAKYTELYDFAPIGYFTLSRDGKILILNLKGAKMLGNDRINLVNRKFGVYVDHESKPVFTLFLENIFNSKTQQICEIDISTNSHTPTYVYLTGIMSEEGDQCFITATDISLRKQSDEELRISHQFSQTLLQTIPFGINIVDENGNILYLNDRLKQLFGEIPKGKKCWQLYRDDKSQCADCPLSAGIRIGETKSTESPGIFGGKTFEITHTGMMYNGQKAVLGTFIDISERKKAEELIRVNNNRLELAMQSANMAWWEMDITTGRVFFDQRKTEMLGYTPEQFTHYIDFMTLVHPDDYDNTMKAMQRHIAGLADRYETEYRILAKSGEYRYFYDVGTIVKRDSMGAPLYVTGLVTDVTERKQTESSLLASESKYQAIFENVQDVFYQTSFSGIILEISPSIKHFSDFNREELTGTSIFELYYHPQEREAVLTKLLVSGELRDYEIRLKTKTGKLKYASINARLVYDVEGNPHHIDGALRDVTDRKIAEKEVLKLNEELEQKVTERTSLLLSANKELEKFSYTASHDLRTPLRAVNGYASMLLEDYADSLNADGIRMLHVIQDNANKMGFLIDDLLAYSHLGRRELVISEIDMYEMAESVYNELIDKPGNENIDFRLQKIPYALGDPALMRQVFTNLIGNAIKYTSKISIRIIEISHRNEGDESIYSVRDNGAGFDMAQYPKLFGVFQRLHSSKEFEGNGIGLAIVHRIIESHKGRVWAEGEINKGATFSFSLPEPNS